MAYSPLQVYTSALVFSPTNSIIRKLFQSEEPKWLKVKSSVDGDWNPWLQTHNDGPKAVAFSATGHLISVTSDGTIKIWDAITDREKLTINNSLSIRLIAISADGRYLAAISGIKTTKIWDLTTGKEQQELQSKKQKKGRLSIYYFSCLFNRRPLSCLR